MLWYGVLSRWLLCYAQKLGLTATEYVDHLISRHFRITNIERLREEDRKTLLNRLVGSMAGGRVFKLEKWIEWFAEPLHRELPRILLVM